MRIGYKKWSRYCSNKKAKKIPKNTLIIDAIGTHQNFGIKKKQLKKLILFRNLTLWIEEPYILIMLKVILN